MTCFTQVVGRTGTDDAKAKDTDVFQMGSR